MLPSILSTVSLRYQLKRAIHVDIFHGTVYCDRVQRHFPGPGFGQWWWWAVAHVHIWPRTPMERYLPDKGTTDLFRPIFFPVYRNKRTASSYLGENPKGHPMVKVVSISGRVPGVDDGQAERGGANFGPLHGPMAHQPAGPSAALSGMANDANTPASSETAITVRDTHSGSSTRCEKSIFRPTKARITTRL